VVDKPQPDNQYEIYRQMSSNVIKSVNVLIQQTHAALIFIYKNYHQILQ